MTDIEKDAKMIADTIKFTDTDNRGQLMHDVAEHLKKESQFYTAELFEKIAVDYGYDRD